VEGATYTSAAQCGTVASCEEAFDIRVDNEEKFSIKMSDG